MSIEEQEQAIHTLRNGGIGNFGDLGGTAGDVRHDVGKFAEPAVTGDLKQVGSFPWIRYQYPPQQVARMWSHIFGECQGGCDDVFIQQVDVVTIRICRVVVKGEISCKHRVLIAPYVSNPILSILGKGYVPG